jgi:flagellar assembly factor FliW
LKELFHRSLARHVQWQLARTILMTAPPQSHAALPDDQSGELVLHFPLGLPGFEMSKKFVLRAQPSFAPVACLQSIDSPDLCFLVVPVGALLADYTLAASADDLRTLGLNEDSPAAEQPNLICLAILTVPRDGGLTANLLAPVVINLASNIAVQAVRADTVYSHRHPITALQPGAYQPASGGHEPKALC